MVSRAAVPLALAAVLLAVPLAWAGCGAGVGKPPLVLAASGDLEGSGILEAWARDFQERSGRRVEVVTDTDDHVCDMARHGECDLILTHVPSDEESLERAGYVTDRREIMRGGYLLVGPSGDPAGAREAEEVTEALKRIAEARQPFVLRVDGSGTAIRASSLWGGSGVEETGDWLVETREGAEEALRLASARGAYTLVGRDTYERLAGELDMETIQDAGEAMEDSYHAMVVSTLTYPDTDTAGALEFTSYLLSENGQGFLELGRYMPPSR